MKKIKLTQGKYALVDDEDFETLNQYKWCADKRPNNVFYAVQNEKIGHNKFRKIKMHRVIISTPKGMETDHADGDGLNNQKKNLRVCNRVENSYNVGMRKNNKSGYKGVHFLPYSNWSKKWHANITVNKKRISIGFFSTPEDAYRAYCAACVKYHGKYAKLQ